MGTPDLENGVVTFVINNESTDNRSRYPVANPADGSHVWHYTSAAVEDAHQAIDAAAAAFPDWSQTHPSRRSDILFKAADLFLERQETLQTYMKLETAAEDAFIEFNIHATAKQLKDIASRIVTISGSFPVVEDDGRSALVLKEPYGVVLGIAPW